jgi:hypothetical protein
VGCGFGYGVGIGVSIHWVKVVPVSIGGFSYGIDGDDGWGKYDSEKR